ncbi:MAG: NTP transferase domain-containing protein [Anaerolineales bacterium]|nr:NTP transferase domain-containing protein [Anaerolineales bacterium]
MLSVIIQAGGMSTRMGEDKALKPFLGKPLIERVIERLSPIADELIVTTNRPADYEFLKTRLMPDLKPGLRSHPPIMRSWRLRRAICPSPVHTSSKARSAFSFRKRRMWSSLA